MKISETKKFVKICSEAFLIFKNYFASNIQDLFLFVQKRLFTFRSMQWGLGLNLKMQAKIPPPPHTFCSLGYCKWFKITKLIEAFNVLTCARQYLETCVGDIFMYERILLPSRIFILYIYRISSLCTLGRVHTAGYTWLQICNNIFQLKILRTETKRGKK
jgi:hypothetical protein